MNFDQFINTWLGKRTDYDKVYRYQCVDLILQYLADVYGIRSGVSGNAIDYWTKPSPRLLQDFEKVSGGARRGDIIVLNGTPGNPYGHIGIAVDANTMLEQNGATGDGDGLGGDEIRYRSIPHSRVAGILRKKGEDMPDYIKAPQHAALFARYFGRMPLPGEVQRDVGKKTYEQMINELGESDEHKKWLAYERPRLQQLITTDQEVIDLYQSILGKQPTQEQIADAKKHYWLNVAKALAKQASSSDLQPIDGLQYQGKQVFVKEN